MQDRIRHLKKETLNRVQGDGLEFYTPLFRFIRSKLGSCKASCAKEAFMDKKISSSKNK